MVMLGKSVNSGKRLLTGLERHKVNRLKNNFASSESINQSLKSKTIKKQFSPEAIDKAIKWTMEENKFNHIFNHPKHDHKLEPLIARAGSHEATILAVLEAIDGHVPVNGKFDDLSVDVLGFPVTVRGFIDNGIPKVGTFYIKWDLE